MSVVTASDEMPICVKRFGRLVTPQIRRLTLSSSSHQFRLTMADAVLQDPVATAAAVHEYCNFLDTFGALGAGGSVTVTDVYSRMRETGLPTGYIGSYMENTDPTATAATGKTNFKYLTFHGCYHSQNHANFPCNLPTSYRTSSSAVAKRPRDASCESCLSVVSFNSTKCVTTSGTLAVLQRSQHALSQI